MTTEGTESTSTDDAALREFAARLFGTTEGKRTDPPSDPTQGNRVPAEGSNTPQRGDRDLREFVNDLFGNHS